MSPEWAATVDSRLAERRARVSDVDSWCRHADGFAWAVNLDELVRRGLLGADPDPDTIAVREDGHDLVRAAGASAVGTSGGGTFWMEWPRLLFSAADQTNPKLNRRRYELIASGRSVVIPPSPQAAVLGPAPEPPSGQLRDFVRATVDAGRDIRLDVPHDLDYYHFLAGLMRVHGFTRMLEIGMERGYSAAAAATGMGTAIDTLVTCDLADRAPILNRMRRVHKVIGDAMDTKNIRRILELFGHRPIDVLFVDSGHDYPTTVAHMGTFATLLQPRLILIDDIVLNEDMARFWADVRTLYGPRAVNACDIDPRVRTCECGFGMVVLDQSLTQSVRDVLPAA
jgi:predicted O-methyltransferase YrrM